jgi:hypothetical protein
MALFAQDYTTRGTCQTQADPCSNCTVYFDGDQGCYSYVCTAAAGQTTTICKYSTQPGQVCILSGNTSTWSCDGCKRHACAIIGSGCFTALGQTYCNCDSVTGDPVEQVQTRTNCTSS